MRHQLGILWTWVTVGTLSAAWADAAPVPIPAPLKVVPGVWMIPGGVLTNHEPDGNSVVFDAPQGLIVVDTGRHSWHREAILSLARAQNKAIVAIVNSHWHLDHVSGNPALRAAYPGLQVYASNAIDGALSGFLASSVSQAPAYLSDPRIAEDLREDIRGDVSTIQNGAALRPDVVIRASRLITIGGRTLKVNLAHDAATSGDIWVYDGKTRIAALGDLVTLPAPFLETACPDGWKIALADIAATPFKTAIPGHGDPMTHDQFVLYQQTFVSFIDCSRSAIPKEECATRWTSSIQPLLGPNAADGQRIQRTAMYYVDMLRANGGQSKYCESTNASPSGAI
jgi:glyoxylase-like metal-dependent hydrolase (beta-lactamase superfamily II)